MLHLTLNIIIVLSLVTVLVYLNQFLKQKKENLEDALDAKINKATQNLSKRIDHLSSDIEAIGLSCNRNNAETKEKVDSLSKWLDELDAELVKEKEHRTDLHKWVENTEYLLIKNVEKVNELELKLEVMVNNLTKKKKVPSAKRRKS
jgi:chromosome segregation ATPase